jgi:hypothetical protein
MEDGKCRTTALVVVVELTPTMTGPRLDKVKDGIGAAAATLDRATDRLAVIAFDGMARVVVDLGVPAAPVKLDLVAASAGAELDAALRLAGTKLRTLVAPSKHVLLVSDKGTPASPVVVKALRGEGVTVSALGIVGADRTTLADLVEIGEGRLYMVEELDVLPRVFMKEVGEAKRAVLHPD